MSKRITVQSPASVANLVCGFDILGMALNEPYDVMTLTLLDKRDVTISTTDGFASPTNPLENVAGAALLAMMKACDSSIGFQVNISKRIKPGSGLGSSAASAAGAVVAANRLLNNRFNNLQLVDFAMCGEEVACGSKHADNVAPVICGGITLVRSTNPLDIVTLDAPLLFITVVHPQIEIKTSDARAIMKQTVPLKSAVRQWGNVAGLVAGLLKHDYDLIGRSLEDHIAEPTRSILIPGFDLVKERCMEAGALGGGISGSGPSLFMMSRDEHTAHEVEKAMRRTFSEMNLEFFTYVTVLNTTGVKTIEAT